MGLISGLTVTLENCPVSTMSSSVGGLGGGGGRDSTSTGFKLGMVAQAYNASTQETEGGVLTSGQPGLHNKTISKTATEFMDKVINK